MTIESKREYERNWYHKNKDRIKDKKKENEKRYKTKKQSIVINHLLSHPCIDCGESDIVVLDFDHIDPATKIRNISDLVNTGAISSLIEEINKCEIRCANCHRRKTSKQFNLYKNSIPDIFVK